MAWTLPEFRELVADSLDSYTQRDGAEHGERLESVLHGDDFLLVRFASGENFRVAIDWERID